MLKAISLFSGIGGFDLGFERAGIETVLQVEQDKHCLAVLERHWPNVRRLDDVRLLGTHQPFDMCPPECEEGCERDPECVGIQEIIDDFGNIDLIYGGFPCQDVSVAGKRAGLDGERSGLWFEFHRILRELRPRWAVIENVPGLLSSNRGRDFGVILQGLEELGFDVAWAILDAQNFGVPQRRRRVFIVAGPSRRSCEQVLSLCESCGGNPETGRATGEGTAASITASAGHHGHSSPRGDGSDNLLVSPTLTGGAEGRGYRGDDGSNAYVAYTVSPARGTGDGHGNAWNSNYIPDIVGQAVNAKWAKGSSGPSGDEVQNMVGVSQGVRRLTPVECERLQGFPDNWTEGQSDSHRYRQLGNAVAVPVSQWLGHRLMAVES